MLSRALCMCMCLCVCVFIVGAAAAEEKTPKRDEVEMKPKLKPQVIRSLRRVSSMCFSLDSTTLLLNLPLTTHTQQQRGKQSKETITTMNTDPQKQNVT